MHTPTRFHFGVAKRRVVGLGMPDLMCHRRGAHSGPDAALTSCAAAAVVVAGESPRISTTSISPVTCASSPCRWMNLNRGFAAHRQRMRKMGGYQRWSSHLTSAPAHRVFKDTEDPLGGRSVLE